MGGKLGTIFAPSRPSRTTTSALYYQIEHSEGSWGIVRHSADGSNRPEPIGRSDFPTTLMDISPDEEYLIFGPTQTAGSAYFRLRTNGLTDSKPELWLRSAPVFFHAVPQARFAPGGKFVFAPLDAGEGTFIPWFPDRPRTEVGDWGVQRLSPDGA